MAVSSANVALYPTQSPRQGDYRAVTPQYLNPPSAAATVASVTPAQSASLSAGAPGISNSAVTLPVGNRLPETATALAPATQHSVHTGHAKEKPPKNPSKGGLNPLVLTAATTALVAAPVLMMTTALGMRMVTEELTGKKVSRHLGGPIYEAVKTVIPGLSPGGLKKTYDLANKFVALSLIPKSAVVIQYGLNTGQPTAVLSGLAQMAAGPVLMMSNSPLQSNFNYLVGAVQTIGFANDVQNNFLLDEGRPMKNFYNFRHLGDAFNPHSELTGHERLKTLSHETKKLSRYLVHDQVYAIGKAGQLLKETAGTLFQGAVHPFETEKQLKHTLRQIHPTHNHGTDVAAGDDAAQTSRHTGNPNLSRLFVTMAYAGLAPVFLAPLAPQVIRPVLGKISPALLNPALLIGDASTITIGLGGQTLLEKALALGQSIELVGTKIGSLAAAAAPTTAIAMWGGAIAGALQQFGSAINLLYYGSRQKKEALTRHDGSA